MSLSIKTIRKKQCKVSSWSGGITKELYIYPEGSSYLSRNFKWRLSSAQVDKEESVFTALPGINRLTMVLQGELYLSHEGHHSTALKEFQQDSFRGDWKTTSRGRVTDFNLMMARGCQGKLEAISINGNESKDIFLNYDLHAENFINKTEAFYIVKGNVDIVADENEKLSLGEGDLVLINVMDKDERSVVKLCNSQSEEAEIIRASIFY